jgi:imidazole glycerol-phosphate synthase subunit HisH
MKSETLTIVDYGCGNITSLHQAFNRLGVETLIASSPQQVAAASRIVLPGVGNFGHAAMALEKQGLRRPLQSAAAHGTPVLGICLGMQLLGDWSEESGQNSPGLGLIPGTIRSLRHFGVLERLPHVGWNNLTPTGNDHPIQVLADSNPDVYFVHSFGFEPHDHSVVKATTEYGAEIVAAVQASNVWGYQFHPEKSSHHGSSFLRLFLDETQSK